MKRTAFLLLALVITLGPAAVWAESDADVIRTARTIALVTQRLPEVKTARERSRLETIRDKAISDLRSMKNARAALKRALSKNYSYVTLCSAGYGLYLVDSKEIDTAVRALVGQMSRMMFAEEFLAQRLLLAIGPAAVPSLTQYLNSSTVIQVLGDMGADAKQAVPALKKILGTGNVTVAAALLKIGTDDAVRAAMPVVLATVQDPNNSYAQLAVRSLGELGKQARKAAIPYIRKAIPYVRELARIAVDPDTRVYAAVALTELGDTDFGVRILGELIENRELHNHYAALRRLGTLGSAAKAAVPSLIRVLLDDADKRYGDRAFTAKTLIEIDPTSPEVASALRKASLQPQLRLRLKEIGVLP